MDMRYDGASNAAFLQLADEPVDRQHCRTVSVDPWLVDGLLNLCIDGAGRIVGVEFCEAREQLLPELLQPDGSPSAEGGTRG